jgi:hypothetical protein
LGALPSNLSAVLGAGHVMPGDRRPILGYLHVGATVTGRMCPRGGVN